ncbi:MAG: hypothetical protein J6W45_05955 [Bacteroidales bacterium]|nr:hypothetical protein [Bacteroidales bacterium]
MKKTILFKVLPLVAAILIGIHCFVGCKKDIDINRNHNIVAPTNDTTYVTDTIVHLHDSIVRGKVLALMGVCQGNEMIISVTSDSTLGSYCDLDNERYYLFGGDTIFVYDNVIAVPLPMDEQGQCRYTWNDTSLTSIKPMDELEFVCRKATVSDSCYIRQQPCLAIYGMPTNIDRYVIKHIINYISR